MKDSSGKLDEPYLLDLPQAAARKLPRFVCDFIEGGAEREAAIARNYAAFDRAIVTPRIGRRTSSTYEANLFGERFAAPIGIAPMGLADLVLPKADIALARAAIAANIPYITSAAAGTDVETLAEATGRVPWFQLYMPRDHTISKAIVKHIADVGVSVLVITLDAPVPGLRLRDLRNGLTLPLRMNSHLIGQLLSKPRWLMSQLLAGPIAFPNFERHVDLSGAHSFAAIMREQTGGALDWKALRDMRQQWKGTLVLKGILAAEDAIKASAIGVDALIVSNHGGRQFDAAPTPLDATAEITIASPKIPVLMDSGIRSGTDVVRAVAAGADFAFIGRPFLHALGALGANGPTALARQLVRDAENALTLSGYRSWKELRNSKASG